MTTLKVDDRQRVRLPEAKPGQVLAYENPGDGRYILTVVTVKTEEPFPPGSLKKFVTAQSNREMLGLLKGCTLEVAE